MKKLSLLFLISILSVTAFAQREKGYRGFVDAGYVLSFSELQYSNGNSEKISDRIVVSTTHGYQILPNLFVGGGVGMNYYYNDNADMGNIGLPIFGALRLDFGSNRLSYFTEGKAGYSVLDIEGTYFNVQAGIRYALSEKIGLNIGVGYQYQYSTSFEGHADGLALKLGIDF